ncbi:hypothetical protein AB0D08_36255 [Kitasatospora sp. NPDC048540]|uniref:hypothetical protein n=1 Tax=unclassified Kitasatospora TaxID=2633591 RepID=UPI00053BB637|nr:hypothetical protein [Kitasatospora sp. MBT63]
MFGLVVFGGCVVMGLLWMGSQARYHYRYAGAEQVQATVVRVDYSDPQHHRPNGMALALPDGRQVRADTDPGDGLPLLEPGAVRTVLVDPHRTSTVAFPAQVGWRPVLFPSVLILVIGLGGTAGMLLYRAFWGHAPVRTPAKARRRR